MALREQQESEEREKWTRKLEGVTICVEWGGQGFCPECGRRKMDGEIHETSCKLGAACAKIRAAREKEKGATQ